MSLSVDKALSKAKTHIKNSEPEQAILLYQGILEKFPKNRRALDGLAGLQQPRPRAFTGAEPPADVMSAVVALYTNGQLEQALAQGQALADQYPSSANLWNILGAINMALGHGEQAVLCLTKALQIDPGFIEGYKNFGVVLKRVGRYEDAITSLSHALKLKPDYVEAYYNLGKLLTDLGRHEEALTNYKMAASLAPDNAEMYNAQGVGFQNMEKFEDALASYRTAIEVDPQLATAHRNQGILLESMGRPEDAVVSYTRATKIKPGFSDAHNSLGIVLMSLGRHGEGIDHFLEALRVKPDDANALENLVICAIQRSDYKELSQGEILGKAIAASGSVISARHLTCLAVDAFIDGDLARTRTLLEQLRSRCADATFLSLRDKTRSFVTAYLNFLTALVAENTEDTAPNEGELLYHLGESHCLSFSHQQFVLSGKPNVVTPKIIFGAKAWHFAKSDDNSYKAFLRNHADNIPDGSMVLLSFGEIDCRRDEGILSHCAKRELAVEPVIADTVTGYVRFVEASFASSKSRRFYVGVPAPVQTDPVSPEDREINARQIEIIQAFNKKLAEEALAAGQGFVDTYTMTASPIGASNSTYHCDEFHLNLAAIEPIAKTIEAQM